MIRQNQIPALLKISGITSYGLSRLTKLSPNTIKNIVSSPSIPDRMTYKTLRKIAAVLSVRIDDLEKCYE